MKGTGAVLGFLGAGLVLLGFMMDGSVASSMLDRVSNIGLLNLKLMLVIAGGAAFVGGMVLVAGGEICDRLPAPAGTKKTTGVDRTGNGEAWRETRSILRTAKIEGTRIYFLDDSTMAVDGVDGTFVDIPSATEAAKAKPT